MLRWRKALKKAPKRIVIKLGSSCVTKDSGGLDQAKIKEICKDLVELKKQDLEIILVCSGAIQTAKGDFPIKSPDISELQALSSIGQNKLIHAYENILSKYELKIGQILLTHDDFKSSSRLFNLKNTIEKLLSWSAIPIINENDCISFDEITLGDNDQLAAMITSNLNADLLLLLTEAMALHDKNPSLKDAQPIAKVSYAENFDEIDTISKSLAGRGGMKTKLEAVRKLTPLGIPVLLSSYTRKPAIFSALLEENCGTFFEAAPTKATHRKAKIINQVRSTCSVIIDKGACDAILANKSLLPVGIKKLEGRFHRGDAIKIMFQRKLVAWGVAEYSSTELRKFLNSGKPADYIKRFSLPNKVFIHKNNLVKKDSL